MRIPAVATANYALQTMHAIIEIQRFSDFGPSDPSFCFARFRFTGQKYPDQIPSSAPAKEEESGFGNAAAALD